MEILRVIVQLGTQDGGRGPFGGEGRWEKESRGLAYHSPTVICAVQGSASPQPSTDPISLCSSLFNQSPFGFSAGAGAPCPHQSKAGCTHT